MIIRTLCFTLSILLPAFARAQDGLPRFDCAALLSATGLGDASDRKSQRLSAAPLRLSWTGYGKPGRDTPVVLVPLRSGVTPQVARSEPVALADGVMSCTLIGMAFRPFMGQETPYTFEDLRGGPRPAELPILLIGRYDNVRAADLAFSQWVESGFAVPVSFPEPMAQASNSDPGVQVFGDHRVFDPLPLLSETRFGEANVLAVNPDRAPQDTRIFLRTAGLDDARVILALCGSADCLDFRNSEPNRAAPTQAPPPQTLADPRPAPVAESAAAPESTPEPTPEPSPKPQTAPPTSPRPADRITEAAPSGIPSGAPSGAPLRLTPLRLTYVGTDGQEEVLPDALASRLDCVLTAVGADVFMDPPDCPGRAFEALRDRHALLKRVDDGHWQIVAGARDRAPNAIIVTLPAGQSGAACRMDLVYDGADGTPVTLALDPVAGSTPAQFTAIPTVPLPVSDGEVTVTLSVSSPAECGGAGRTVSLPTDTVLQVTLVGERQPNRAVLYVIAMDAGDLEVALGLDTAERLRLGAGVLGSIEAAQARLAASWGDRAWSLSSVAITRLDETDGLVRVLALPSDALRTGADTRFATIPAAARTALAEMRPRISPENLALALEPAIRDAAARGVSDLSLALIAPATPRTAVALTDPCTDQRFATLAQDLTLPNGPRITVSVFPLVRLRDGDAPDLAGLQPLTFDPDAPTRPAGLTRCRLASETLTTYPYFIEPWRPAGDIPGRYTAALSDRLALHLSTQLTEDKARP
ncbi:MAG: hypothetical protein CML66_21365 [Rhodobacteraceae bacterium]|nr:hypothetical protein [Paracoccaceae bacterium]